MELIGTDRQHQPPARRRSQADAQAWCPPESCGLLLLDVRVRSAENRARKIDELQFIFTSPTFTANEVTDKIRKERKEFHIPKASCGLA